MLKKLLTLSLVAVMLSTVALASNGVVGFGVATYAEEAEEVTETFKGAAAIDVLKISCTETGETETQTATSTIQYASSVISTVNSDGNHTVWLLVRANVGENWLMNQSTLKLATGFKATAAAKGTAYYNPSTKAAWEDASDGTLDTLLPHPKDVEGAPSSAKGGSNGSKNQYYSVSNLSGESFVDSYDGTYLYFAVEVVSNKSLMLYKSDLEYTSSNNNWYIAVTGVKQAPAVDDFSDAVIAWDNGTCTISNVPATGTAMLIAASFNGTTMVDAQVASIDAATDAENGVITETFTDLEAGEKVRVFLWDPTTLAPAIEVAEF